jgi:hypothetical protein
LIVTGNTVSLSHNALADYLTTNFLGPARTWDIDSAFATFVAKETGVWRQLGVERSSQHLLPPSGSLASPIACHLMNPTFYVGDPENPVTDDPTSPTIQLMNDSGFSSNNCLVFDQVCRREETLDVLHFYNEDIYKPHREFVGEIQRHMSAVVEVCWGRDVWKEMECNMGIRLVSFPLWGAFSSVRLYLELGDDGRSLIRFILRVYHPQFFCRSGIGKLGPERRKSFGQAQDKALTVAARLAGETGSISQVYYFQTETPFRSWCRLSRDQESTRDSHVENANQALQTAFPERYRQRELRKAGRTKDISDLETFLKGPLNPMVTRSIAQEISHDKIVSFLSA